MRDKQKDKQHAVDMTCTALSVLPCIFFVRKDFAIGVFFVFCVLAGLYLFKAHRREKTYIDAALNFVAWTFFGALAGLGAIAPVIAFLVSLATTYVVVPRISKRILTTT